MAIELLLNVTLFVFSQLVYPKITHLNFLGSSIFLPFFTIIMELCAVLYVVTSWYSNFRELTGKELLKSLIVKGEGPNIEFKETLRFDTKSQLYNKNLEQSALKTLAAFANTSGGHLVIGVNDKAQITGLSKDYKTLPKPNADGFLNHLSQIIRSQLGIEMIKLVDSKFMTHSQSLQEVVIVRVNPSRKPIFYKNGDIEEFFIRINNTTQPLNVRETSEYISSHKQFSK